jgi:hypothetical protein
MRPRGERVGKHQGGRRAEAGRSGREGREEATADRRGTRAGASRVSAASRPNEPRATTVGRSCESSWPESLSIAHCAGMREPAPQPRSFCAAFFASAAFLASSASASRLAAASARSLRIRARRARSDLASSVLPAVEQEGGRGRAIRSQFAGQGVRCLEREWRHVPAACLAAYRSAAAFFSAASL